MKTLHSGLKTAEVAERSGYSVQQIRNLERDGVLPPAPRTPSGYRSYADVHVSSALAYRPLVVAVGPVEAKTIMRTVHTAPIAETYAALDAAHQRLHTARVDLRLARDAVAAMTEETMAEPRAADQLTITELGIALGVRPSTLRHWETEGLLIPIRDHDRATRRYDPPAVRNARIIHQLRLGGYPIGAVRLIIAALELPGRPGRPGRPSRIDHALAARELRITARSAALLEAGARIYPMLSR